LNITPQNLIVSAANESLAEQLIRSVSVPGQSNSGVHNPMRDSLTILTESRLDDNNEKEWFLTAAAGTDTVEVAYLDGNDTPWLESTDGFTVDGTTFKVRIDAGVAPLDWRGLAKSTGTAAQG
ncbi:Clp protease ClpP, partial [Shigella boydii]|nr:Clp protease ClpP [Shigella boydii]